MSGLDACDDTNAKRRRRGRRRLSVAEKREK
jgi:hypothetical protein